MAAPTMVNVCVKVLSGRKEQIVFYFNSSGTVLSNFQQKEKNLLCSALSHLLFPL